MLNQLRCLNAFESTIRYSVISHTTFIYKKEPKFRLRGLGKESSFHPSFSLN